MSLLVVIAGSLIAIVLAGLFSPFKIQTPVSSQGVASAVCDEDRYMEDIQPLLTQWDDAAALANHASRMNLPLPISNMQAARRAVRQMETADCFATAHAKLVTAMDASIDAYMSFMADEGDTAVQGAFTAASDAFDDYWAELAKVNP